MMNERGTSMEDIELIMSHRHDLGSDYWTTEDLRVLKGSPYSMVASVQMLVELGLTKEHEIFKHVADLLFSLQRDDGRFKVYPSGGIYPCQTAQVARTLCYMGYSLDERLQKTFQHFIVSQYRDGGFKCNKYSFGHGEETEYSNPLPTLAILDVFRFIDWKNHENVIQDAVEFLLQHWRIRKPIGPCHYGMGTRFMQVEYPLGNYNIFYYVYVLSFYPYARRDIRFQEALEELRKKQVNGQLVIERCNPKLRELKMCVKGVPNEYVLRRMNEIDGNVRNHKSSVEGGQADG